MIDCYFQQPLACKMFRLLFLESSRISEAEAWGRDGLRPLEEVFQAPRLIVNGHSIRFYIDFPGSLDAGRCQWALLSLLHSRESLPLHA